ncbi:hypothetical protein SH449x_001875 [Pirellulaceae bacterium SH449]
MSPFDHFTLIAKTSVRNGSLPLVFNFDKLRITCLTCSVFLFQVAMGAVSTNGQHPMLSKEFIATYQRLQAPWSQDIDATAEEVCKVVSTAYNVPIWIDMGLPRDRKVSLPSKLETLDEMLSDLAQKLDGELVILEGTVLFLPIEIAPRVSAQYWRNKSTSLGLIWSRPSQPPFSWNAGTSAQQIAIQLNALAKLDASWLELVARDLWPERRFEKQSLLTIATCILSSMRLEVDLGAKPPNVRSLDGDIATKHTIDWTYAADQLKRLGDDHCKSWKREHPDVEIKTQDRTWIITATPAEHMRLIGPLIPKVKYQKPSSEGAVYQGELRGTLGSALDAIAKTANLQLSPWPLPEAVARREIQISYNRATIDDILAELGKAGRLKIERNGNQCVLTILD